MTAVILVAAGLIIVEHAPRVLKARRTARPLLPTAPLEIGSVGRMGQQHARLGIVIYSDFQCPYCGTFARDILPALRRQYVDRGILLIDFRHFPLTSIHKNAAAAAEAAHCAGTMGKFTEMHDLMFSLPLALDEGSLADRSRALGFEPAKFRACMMSNGRDGVRDDIAAGKSLGVTVTPTFFLGSVTNSGLAVRERFDGNRPLKDFVDFLRRSGEGL